MCLHITYISIDIDIFLSLVTLQLPALFVRLRIPSGIMYVNIYI